MSDTYYDESYPPTVYAPDPSISTLVPNTGSAAAGAITVTVNGTEFDASSVVEIAQQAQPTTYVSPTQLTVSYNPSVSGTVQFTVRRGMHESNSVAFVVSAIGEEPTEEPAAWGESKRFPWQLPDGSGEVPTAASTEPDDPEVPEVPQPPEPTSQAI